MERDPRPHVLITAVQVPFTSGGAEVLVEGLRRELTARDFVVDVVQIPFSAEPKDDLLKQVVLWRSLDVSTFAGHPVDLVIGTKFPSYMVRHPNKAVWLVHQHRQIYDLYGSRFGDSGNTPHDEARRQMLIDADRTALAECRGIYPISNNVQSRLQRYLDQPSESVFPPLPQGDAYRSEAPQPYVLSVGRICSIKRVDLMLKALPQIAGYVKLKIVGTPDEKGIEEYFHNEIEKHHLWDRVEFLGRVSDEELIDLYARARMIYYAPFDEDYGYVTLEGLASGKPIITASDSGGVLEFVRHEENGLIAEPTESGIAEAVNRLFEDEELYARLCSQCASSCVRTDWDYVVERLTSSLRESDEVPAVANLK